MNSYETLWFYGRIRGIPPDILKRRIDQLIHGVGLVKYAHRNCGNYSGGNKRKLSLAVTLIGNPKLLLLDEPSSGMDPEARRHMWDVIAAVSKDRSVLLTTHSMEVRSHRYATSIGDIVSCIYVAGMRSPLHSRWHHG
jgi:ATP-binding cassette subfamily A (ABC1) protein 3